MSFPTKSLIMNSDGSKCQISYLHGWKILQFATMDIFAMNLYVK